MRLSDDVGQLLGDPVVQVTGDTPPLLFRGHTRHRVPVGAELPGGADDEQRVGTQAKDVADDEPVGVERREHRVVHPGQGGQDRPGPKPGRELVVVALRLADETDGRHREQDGNEGLHGGDEFVTARGRLGARVERARQLG